MNTGYIVERRTKSEEWVEVTSYAVSELSYTVSRLVEKEEYSFRVSGKK